MPSWPTTLPQAPLLDGFHETSPDTTLRSTTDTGPAKVRARTTAGTGRLSLAYIMSRAETDALQDFYTDDVLSGALKFTFPHPRSGDTVTCRFRQPPAYAPVNGNFFRVALELEVLP